MRQRFARIVLWLFVIDLGIALGAGLYETKVELPRWASSAVSAAKSPEALTSKTLSPRPSNPGIRFWTYATTVPLTLLTIASFVVLRWADTETRRWWLIAAWAAGAERLLTFLYFIPTMIQLTSGFEPNARAVAFRWSQVSWVRHAILLIAWLAALQAFALFARPRHRHTKPHLTVAREKDVDVTEMKLGA
jgi:hypothetical protein